MGREDWYRNTTWTEEDRRAFRARLNRSRGSFHKAQYLRIQALYLECEATPPQPAAALALLDELLRDHPDPSQVAEAHRQRASCLSRLAREGEQALSALRNALAAEDEYPHSTGSAFLDYAELILRLDRHDLFDDAVSRLAARRADLLFPIYEYRWGAATAFICERLGRQPEAQEAAVVALAAAAKSESPFRYHRHLGLVERTEAAVQQHLWRLAGANRSGSATDGKGDG